MKRLFALTATVTAAALIVGTVGCRNNNSSPSPGQSTVGALRVSTKFAGQTNDFAFDFFKKVYAEEAKTENAFVSPLSLHIALGMLMNGANGQTQTEIQKTLKLDAQTLSEANDTYANLMTNLPGVDPNVKLSIANSIWYRNGFAVETSFQEVLRKTFQADITGLDFNSPTAKDQINKWASDKTSGKIPTVISEVKPEHVMFLLNALYFKGDWKTKFDTKQTYDTDFKLLSGQTKSVKMMRLDVPLRRAFRPSYTAFELPYSQGNYVMTVLLPNENSSLDAMMNTLSGTEWTSLQQGMAEGKIDIGLPRFGMKYSIKLNSILSGMGMPTAFSNAADLSGISKGKQLYVDFVKQDTYVAVDESGTEAAAVTSIGVGVTSAGMSYICNRPFAFVIHEKTTGTVLFMGKIVNPSPNA